MRSSSGIRFTSGMFVASLFFGLILMVLCLGSLFIFRPAGSSTAPNAIFTVIPAPTATVILPTEVSPTPTLSPEEMASGKIDIGVMVQITGTEGDGLRLRAEPGVSAAPVVLGKDGEQFLVKDGPSHKDGYNWWKLESPKDGSRSGWAAADYLAVVPEN
ncbi:SH3 domain-containing protein [Leptolinea tardivitalis]|uniref:SH3 domain-containing protein n=1 Tax=Leptolinea tardivitalis TaxID=229920 RepID=UPI0007856510|nr:SH3 domain-containing protein [Leptolinea tardivitalis]GAP20072.1 hypothetical protein LTAR_00257 [Leptolinea tardivitalis]